MEKTQRDFLLRSAAGCDQEASSAKAATTSAAGYRARLESAGMPDNVRAEG